MVRKVKPTIATLALLVVAQVPVQRVAAADEAAAASPPCHMHMEPALKRATRSTARYAVPDVRLVREDGQAVSFPGEIDDGKPVVLDFIFTTCTTICPVSSQILSQLQERLGSRRDDVHIVSISIDPEQDTPARLREYAAKFHAGAEWHHYTGTVEASVALQRAFEAYRGDKMSHVPVTFLRAAPGRPWVRIDGFASSAELAGELRELVATK